MRGETCSPFPRWSVCRIPETSDVGSHLPPPPSFSRPAVFKLLIPTCKLIAHFEQFIARFSHSNSNWSSTELITHHTRIFQHNIETENFQTGLSQLNEFVSDIEWLQWWWIWLNKILESVLVSLLQNISNICDNCSCKSFSTNTFCETHAVNRRFIPVLIVIMSVRTLTSSD